MRFALVALLVCPFAAHSTACKSHRQSPDGGSIATFSANQKDKQEAEEKKPPTESSGKNNPSPASKTVAFADPIVTEAVKYAELSTSWGEGQLVDIGPSASVTATPQGAVFVTRDDRVLLARRVGAGGFQPIDLPAEAFSKYGWGPSVSATHAYWASRTGRLMRASLKSLKTEVLFPHAREATRTAVQTAAGRDIVAFVASIEDRSFAYLWASAGSGSPEIIDASADGHQATSVTLVRGTPHPRLIVLEGRTSMSPVHSRVIRVTQRRVILEDNDVVWIGPGSHALTEIHALDAKQGSTLAFLPTQKDFNGFGMAELLIKESGGESPEPTWQLYPNGLDPAPLAAAHICGGDYVVFARPSEKRPRAPQELRIARLDSDEGREEGAVLVRSRAFNDVSIASTKGGALLVWTADRRTWGRVLTCP